jgi:putative ABC transport system ATP-binding protein
VSIIQVENLTKTYTDGALPVKALNQVNLAIQKGEFTAIVGPSGSGKTTLLNLLGGLDSPTSGSIQIAGNAISKLKPSELIDFRLRHIGFVFQAYNLIPVLSAQENIEFIMELQGIPIHKRRMRSTQLLQAVGLADRANQRPGKLSGGQQQRIAVARALATSPAYILADEPTANLDSHTAENLLEMMSQLNLQEQVTFLFSTHDPRVMKKAKRIITIEDGSIKSDEQV